MKLGNYLTTQTNTCNLFKEFKQPAPNITKSVTPPSVSKTITPEDKKNIDMKKAAVALGFAGVGLALAAVALYKHKKPNLEQVVPPNTQEEVADIAIDVVEDVQEKMQTTALEFREKLVAGLKEKFGIEVDKSALASIMNKDELMESLEKLKPANYVASSSNVQKGIFSVDLRSRSLHSDGQLSVEKLLDEVAKYADELSQKTNGESKFIFALSDHENIDGVQEAVKLIAQNPDKYKNVKFVPAVEFGFVHAADKSSNNFEISEMIAYGINPFDEKLNNFLNATYKKRAKFVEAFIKKLNDAKLGVNYSAEEFAKAYDMDLSQIHKMNIHWDLNHYANTKLAYANSKRPVDTYAEHMSKKVGGAKSLWDLQQTSTDFSSAREAYVVGEIREAMKPKMTEDGLISNLSENRYEEVINALNETEAVIGLAHPFYLSEFKVTNIGDFVSGLIKNSKGMLKMTESSHQAYKNVDFDKVSALNATLEKLGLKPFGGRDIQGSKFI